jgi:hypothetical protein
LQDAAPREVSDCKTRIFSEILTALNLATDDGARGVNAEYMAQNFLTVFARRRAVQSDRAGFPEFRASAHRGNPDDVGRSEHTSIRRSLNLLALAGRPSNGKSLGASRFPRRLVHS